MVSRIFKTDIPKEYRANFIHLYFDIGWFGVLSGSSINFLKIYATRLGANGFQLGMLDASAAVVSLMLAIPAGHWIAKRPIGPAVFWTSVLYRIGFLFWAMLPWFFGDAGQVWALVVLALVMAIPLTPLSVGFNALFASAVPDEYRAHVAGIRNVVLSVAYVATSLGSGYLLERFDFPIGYQIVFAIGFIGAAMSSLHLYFIRPLASSDARPPLSELEPVQGPERAARRSGFLSARHGVLSAIRADVWSTGFRKVLVVMFGFHLAQYLALPLFPLYQVYNLNLTDQQIGISSALFYLIVLAGSTQLRRIVHRLGHKQVTALGVIGMGLYPFLLAISRTALQFYGLSSLGGLSWALAAGAYANYLLEHIPAHDRPAYLAWYNVILNASILAGSLAGPLVANEIGLIPALFVFAAARTLAGLAIWKWG
ncbi:MAG: MFS transporter [Chloroflexi bacterium]|nr:MFS transporter [Chloroflexota bacterium]MBI3341095.1 MFS transporter [Chloroflexota bacterium]